MPLPRTIRPDELVRLLARGEAPLLFDLRKVPDYTSDPRLLPGAIKRSLAEIEAWGPSIPPGKPVVVYCAEGRTVGSAAVDWLQGHGHAARQIEGGFAAWRAAGLPLEKPRKDEP